MTTIHFRINNAGNNISGYNKKHIYTNKATRQPLAIEVKQNHR